METTLMNEKPQTKPETVEPPSDCRSGSILCSLPLSPFYAKDGIEIYHADCRRLLPFVEADMILSDPPYGMNYKPLRGSDGSKRFEDAVIGDDQPFDPYPWLGFRYVVLWGANWYASRLPDSGGWFVWDKTPNGGKNGFVASHAELAWTNLCGRTLKYAQQWGGEAHGNEPHVHPTQKPVPLMEWCIGQAPDDAVVIVDPYMGSGSVLIAARNMGRRAVGIEIEEKYCEIAAKRLAQGVLF